MSPSRVRNGKAVSNTTRRRKANVSTPLANPGGASQAQPLSHEEIATRAYYSFLQRAGDHGDDWGDWLRAEAELIRERNLDRIASGS